MMFAYPAADAPTIVVVLLVVFGLVSCCSLKVQLMYPIQMDAGVSMM